MEFGIKISGIESCSSIFTSCIFLLILQTAGVLSLKDGHQISISLANSLCHYTKIPGVVKLVVSRDFTQGIQVYSKGWKGDSWGFLHKNSSYNSRSSSRSSGSARFNLIIEDPDITKKRRKRGASTFPAKPMPFYPPPVPPPKRPCQKKDLVFGTKSQIDFEVVKIRTNNGSLYALVLRPELPWAQAVYACATHGMTLSDVRNNEELNFLNSFLYDYVDAAKPSVEIWIGGHRFRGGVEKRQAMWFEGNQDIQKEVWNEHEGDDVEKQENCVMLENRIPPLFKATDITCEGCRPFICKSLI